MNFDERFENGDRFDIFVGLKDKDVYEEVLNTDDFLRILVEICGEKKIGFTLHTQIGGYAHNKGYTTENSIRIVLIGVSEEDVVAIGERLKKEINTDTIMITKTNIEYSFM